MISENTQVNFLDLKAQYLSIKPEIDLAISEVFEKVSFAGGPFVAKFEKEFARAHQSDYCVAVNNGTSALHIMMMALDIGPGDEVIVPCNTFFASAEAVSLAGAIPVFVDCDDVYYNLDSSKIESALTKRTKAILAVHLYGQPAPLERLKQVADQFDLILLEDCAQAHLAKYQEKYVGNYGLAGSFSFYPGKNLGAYGEAGAVITNDKSLYEKMQMIKDHGSPKKYHHHLIGHNYRMEALQAAVLSVKLKYLSEWTARRQAVAEEYISQLNGVDAIVLPKTIAGAEHVYHLFVIQVPDRNDLMAYLSENGVYTGIHYPIPCHLQKAYADLNYPVGSFENGERLADTVVSLPMSEQLSDDQVSYVCNLIKQYYQK